MSRSFSTPDFKLYSGSEEASPYVSLEKLLDQDPSLYLKEALGFAVAAHNMQINKKGFVQDNSCLGDKG